MIKLRSLAAAAAILCFALVPVALASIDGTISIGCQLNDRRTVGLNANTNIPVNATPSITYSNGAGANQANQFYQATRTFSGTTDAITVDATNKDSYGTTLAMVRVKAIFIQNTSTHNQTFFGGSNALVGPLGATSTVTLPPGGFACFATPDATGWTVTASTADVINATGTNADTYNIVILGSTT
jgi:hypothetical protein